MEHRNRTVTAVPAGEHSTKVRGHSSVASAPRRHRWRCAAAVAVSEPTRVPKCRLEFEHLEQPARKQCTGARRRGQGGLD